MTGGLPVERCPSCGAAGPFTAREEHRDSINGRLYVMRLCGSCGLLFADPFEHPGAEWYARFSSADSYEGEASDWRFDWFLERGFRAGGRLLDAGCGVGYFLERARSAGYQVAGLDPNPEAVAGANSRGLEVFLGSLEEFAKTVPPESFDVVTLFDVLEHFDDPREMVRAAVSLLKPGGGLVVTTPNGRRPIPFGREAFDLPPHHLTRWEPEVLEGFLKREGLRVEFADHAYLPAGEFSRHLVDRATRACVWLVKRALYGRAAEGATLTGLIAARRGTGKAPAAFVNDKDKRRLLVRRFQALLGAATEPFFLPLRWYYRLARPGTGVSSRVLAVKPGPPDSRA